jgi:hypothetical protein
VVGQLVAAAGGDVLKRIGPEAPAEANPFIDKGVLAIGIIISLGILASAGGIVIGLLSKRGGVVGGFEGMAHKGTGILWGSITSLVLLLGIGAVLALIAILAPA